jgi:hypothetical protein
MLIARWVAVVVFGAALLYAALSTSRCPYQLMSFAVMT